MPVTVLKGDIFTTTKAYRRAEYSVRTPGETETSFPHRPSLGLFISRSDLHTRSALRHPNTPSILKQESSLTWGKRTTVTSHQILQG